MHRTIAICKETKDDTQTRAPLTPAHVRALTREHGLRVLVEPMPRRVFREQEYADAGAEITADLSGANVILGIKEIYPPHLRAGRRYCFFSHTIKGQAYNMPMLRHILDDGITLIDYELIRDEGGRRLVYFGNFAGYAGMIDSLWALGRRLAWEGVMTPFADIGYAATYDSLTAAEAAVAAAGRRIADEGLPPGLVPLVTAFTGYGNVSRGAQHIYNLLPTVTLRPFELLAMIADGGFSDRAVYKIEFREQDLYAPHTAGAPFDLVELYAHPDRYRGIFEPYLPHLTMLINGIYWEPRYDRLLSRATARHLWADGAQPRLRVVGDISCDIEGSVELTVKSTHADDPVYVYEPARDDIRMGWEGAGPVILAVDTLPTELPREASDFFGDCMLPFIPALAACDFTRAYDGLALPPELRRAIIAHRGSLTPEYTQLGEYLV